MWRGDLVQSSPFRDEEVQVHETRLDNGRTSSPAGRLSATAHLNFSLSLFFFSPANLNRSYNKSGSQKEDNNGKEGKDLVH